MNRHLRPLITLGALASLATPAAAAGADAATSPYTPTGKKVNCINARQIQSTDVLDNQSVLFKLSGGTYYINHLPNRCSGLKMQDGFSYEQRGSSDLCNVDVIKPVRTGAGASYGPCPLGEFEEVTKTSK